MLPCVRKLACYPCAKPTHSYRLLATANNAHLPGRLGDDSRTVGTDPRTDPAMLVAAEKYGALGRANSYGIGTSLLPVECSLGTSHVGSLPPPSASLLSVLSVSLPPQSHSLSVSPCLH